MKSLARKLICDILETGISALYKRFQAGLVNLEIRKKSGNFVVQQNSEINQGF